MILKEGTEDSSGKGQILSNINACQAVVDVVKTTLGKLNQKRKRVKIFYTSLSDELSSTKKVHDQGILFNDSDKD